MPGQKSELKVADDQENENYIKTEHIVRKSIFSHVKKLSIHFQDSCFEQVNTGISDCLQINQIVEFLVICSTTLTVNQST